MKFAPRKDRRAHFRVRAAMTLLAVAVLPFLLHAAAPSWWSQRGVLIENASPDDFAPANQGQAKNVAKAAAVEMDARFIGGAGEQVHSLIDSWSVPETATNDFAPINLGQLKNLAKPFYDRLISVGLADHYPWLTSQNDPDDFAVANIGQVKKLFSFDVPRPNDLGDPHADRLAAGEYSANLAIQDYAAWIWGDHFLTGSDFERNYPRRISSLSAVKSVAAGEHHLAVLHNDGTISTWGENLAGQLGDGTNLSRSAPAPVPNLSSVISVKAGGAHTLALQHDGTVLSWGANYYGQLGTGDTNPSSVPVLVSGMTSVTRIAAGNSRSVALTADGAVWIWGYERYSGGDIFSPSPRVVPDLNDIVEIAAGYEHNVVLKADGTVWTWGSNYANQLGTGAPRSIYQGVPVQVPYLSDITRIASSYDHTLAVARDGTVWAWGNNFSGQLGDGTNAERQTPVHITALNDVIAVATAYNYSLAMKADGSVWAWGDFAPGIMPGLNPRLPQQVGFGVFDSNHNGMDDRWEMQFFANLDQAPDADFDGDGVSNRTEYFRGTNPIDYYNGVAPVVEIAGGNNQIGSPGTFLAKPFKVRVFSGTAQILVNAPVTFSLSSGSGGLATTFGGPQQQTLSVRTDAVGEAYVYHALPDVAGISTRTTARAGNALFVDVTFRGISSLSPPPPPTPTPDPNASPTPTPSATPTPPIAPYRYAIIDLGKDRYPKRINNQGQILIEGADDNGNWGNFRWKGGVMERLTYAGTPELPKATDINDDGIVVGYFWKFSSWVNNGENEREAGLTWAADNSEAVKTSAPVAVPSWGFRLPGTVKQSYFSAINNHNVIFGAVRTSGGYEPRFRNEFSIYNAYRWIEGSAPTQLSSGAATFVAESSTFTFSGAIDEISKANADGHYIGTKLTQLRIVSPNPATVGGTLTGMVDGNSVSFSPVDINEAGIVAGSAGADMVVRSFPASQITISGASPLAINDHARPVASGSPAPSPTPTPIPAPQILAWVGNALAVFERQPDTQTWHPFGLEEMIPSMPGWDYLEPYDMNDSGSIVGIGWYKDPSTPGAPGEYHAFLLVPVELMVDGDRDGGMSFDDPVVHAADLTSEDRPYRFWVNDDQDAGSGISNSEEVTPPQLRDNLDEKIQSVRDCEDLTRVWLNLRGLTDSFKSGELRFVIRFRSLQLGNPAIRIFRAAENGGRRYVTDEGWGLLQASPSFNHALPGTNGPGIASSTTGIHVDRQFWQGVDESSPVINLLFEGVEEGTGEFYCQIIDRNGRTRGTTGGVWLKVQNIKRLYQRAKVKSQP